MLNVLADALSRLDNCKSNGEAAGNYDICESDSDFDIQVISADLLQSEDRDMDDSDLLAPPPPLIDPKFNIKEHQSKDSKLGAIITSLNEKGHKSKFSKRYIVLDSILYFITRDETLLMAIPKSIQQSLISDVHESVLTHLGRDKTMEFIAKSYHWPGRTRDVQKFLKACIPCNQRGAEPNKIPLQKVVYPKIPWYEISIDLLTLYESSEGFRYCLTMIDKFSAFIECYPLRTKHTIGVARALLAHFSRFGWSRRVCSDRGTEFVSEVIKEITKLGHSHHILSTPRNPRSNGRCERTNSIVAKCLGAVSRKSDWPSYLPGFCGALNASKHSVSKHSPFYTVFHREPVLPIHSLLKPRGIFYGDDDTLPKYLENMHKAYYLVRKNLKLQHEKNKLYYDKKFNVEPVMYSLGDAVYVKDYARKDKMDPKYLPYFRIIFEQSPNSFIVQHQVTGAQRLVHANDLKLAFEDAHWDSVPRNYPRRAARNAVHDIDSVGSAFSNAESSNDSPNDSPEDGQDVSSHDDIIGSQHSASLTPRQRSLRDHDIDSDSSSDDQTERPIRLPRKAKQKALHKLKHVKEVVSSPPESHNNVNEIVQKQVQASLSQFMTSFQSAFANTFQQPPCTKDT